MVFGLGNIVQGLAGNLTELSVEKLTTEYGNYLINEETIHSGYQLIRDTIIFTDIRIIFVDKQGTTGKKTALKSIFLMNIVNAEMETAGRGFDDSEITITYLENIRLQARQEVLVTHKFEFPKSTDIVPLYKYLFELAYKNRLAINQLS